MSPDKQGMGEDAVSKAAEIGLASQLDEVEALNVNVDANPLEVMQGNIDSVSIEGKGMVMQKDLRAEELQMETSRISINPFQAAFGNIELEHPTDAATRVVLTEQDITRAFNSEFIYSKLQNLDVTVDNQPTKVDVQHVEFRLPGEGKAGLENEILLQGTNEKKQVAFTAVPRTSDGGERIVLEDVQYTEGKELSPELTDALLEKASELLDLRNFQMEGMSLRLKGLDVQQGRITLQAETHIEKFPSS